MPYETIKNSTRSDSQIKKSTFLPYPVRVLALMAIKRFFKCCDPLIHYPIMVYLTFTLLALKLVILHLFLILLILAFVLTHESGSDKIQYQQVPRGIF